MRNSGVGEKPRPHLPRPLQPSRTADIYVNGIEEKSLCPWEEVMITKLIIFNFSTFNFYNNHICIINNRRHSFLTWLMIFTLLPYFFSINFVAISWNVCRWTPFWTCNMTEIITFSFFFGEYSPARFSFSTHNIVNLRTICKR